MAAPLGASAAAPARGERPVSASLSVRPEVRGEAPAGGGPAASRRGDAAELLRRAERSFDLGDVRDAVVSARAAARAGGGARAHIVAGKALLADDRLAEAEVELSAAARLAPGDSDARQLLARVQARRQRGE